MRILPGISIKKPFPIDRIANLKSLNCVVEEVSVVTIREIEYSLVIKVALLLFIDNYLLFLTKLLRHITLAKWV